MGVDFCLNVRFGHCLAAPIHYEYAWQTWPQNVMASLQLDEPIYSFGCSINGVWYAVNVLMVSTHARSTGRWWHQIYCHNDGMMCQSRSCKFIDKLRMRSVVTLSWSSRLRGCSVLDTMGIQWPKRQKALYSPGGHANNFGVFHCSFTVFSCCRKGVLPDANGCTFIEKR